MADIKYVIEVDEAGAVKSITNFADEIDKLGNTSKDSDGKAQSLFATIAGASIVADAAKKAFGALKDWVASTGDEFLESEKIQNQLTATMKNLGIDTSANAKKFDDFANSIAEVTTVDDDAVKSLMSLGMRMGISGGQIEDATTKAIGLSKAFGIDLEGAMKMVAQAGEGNFAMMSRYVPQLKGAKDESEQVAIAQKVMADGFRIAKEEVNTTGGQIEQAKNRMNNAKESIGQFTAQIEAMAANALAPATEALAGFLEKLTRLQERDATFKFNKEAAELREQFYGAATAAGVLDKAQQTLFEEHGAILKNTTKNSAESVSYLRRAIEDLADQYPKAAAYIKSLQPPLTQTSMSMKSAATATKSLADELGVDTFGKVNERITKLTAALKLYKGQMTPEAEKKLNAELERLGKSFYDQEKILKLVHPVVTRTKDELLKMAPALDRDTLALAKFDEAATRASGHLAKSWRDAINDALDATDKWLQGASQAINSITAAINQYYTNKAIKLDNDYQKQLENIKNSQMSEEQKQIAITALEAEYEMKRKELQKKQAESQKATAIVEAVINVAQGITKALSALPPPFNIALAAITAAAGAAQIALIKSTPIPLAQGAIFKQPTFLQSPNSGQDYQVSEGSEMEMIASPRAIREAIFGKGGDRGMGGSAPIYVTVPVYLDGKILDQRTVRVLKRESELGRLKLAGKAVV